MTAWAQEVTVGPVTVDTGQPWVDFFQVVILLVLIFLMVIVRDRTRR